MCAAFHDDDAHHLYVTPGRRSRAALDARARIRLSLDLRPTSRSSSAPRPPTSRARSLKEAEPELEKLVRSGYRTVVTWPRRGEGERAAYNLARLQARWLDDDAARAARRGRSCASRTATLRDGFIAAGLRLAVIPEHRLFRRRRAERTAAERRARRRGALRSFTDLRTGDIVVHEDHGVARFAGFDTKTVAGVTRDYLELEYAGHGQGLHARRPAREDHALRRRRRQRTRRCPSSAASAGRRSRRAPGAPRRSSPASCSTSTPSAAAAPATRSRPTATGSASSRPRFPWTRDAPTSARRSRRSRPTWSAPQPMDRLICGDVGYGKTEVALRAAFKAADDGKQVLVLAPTTILAQQHFGTFAERLQGLPVHDRARRQPLPLRRRAARGRRGASTRARSTSSSARTALLSAATCARRTSGC